MKKNINFPIDIVLMWVDGSDSKWLKQRNAYLSKDVLSDEQLEKLTQQYRNWDNLKYVFRSIEENMPWIRTIHFVTNGQRPNWLNLENPKLNWVKHEDFMNIDYLPTFSANPIELSVHNILELSEHFILFNDDLFCTKKTKMTDFFSENGLPKDQCILYRIAGVSYGAVFDHIVMNDISVINQNFNRREVLKKHYRKFFSFKNGFLQTLLSMTYLPTNHFPGFVINHMPQAFLKSTFNEVWKKEHDILHNTCMNKFRNIMDVNQYLMREWQLVTGRFEPANIMKASKYFSLFPQQLEQACIAIESGRYRMMCINDVEVGNFDETKTKINESFNKIFPHKSSFEL